MNRAAQQRCLLALGTLLVAGIIVGPLRANVAAAPIVLCALLLTSPRIAVPKAIVSLLLVMFLHGIICVIMGSVSVSSFVTTYLALTVTFLMFCLGTAGFQDVTKPIKIYLTLCIGLALIGWVQMASVIVGFRPGYDFSYILNSTAVGDGGVLGVRLNSILPEPSHVASTLGPALAVAVMRIFGQLKAYLGLRGAVAILGFGVFSGSTVVYLLLGIVVMICLSRLSIRSFLVAATVASVLGVVQFGEVYETQSLRFSALMSLYLDDTGLDGVDASSYSLFAHSETASQQFRATLGWGGGVGSHEQFFDTQYRSFLAHIEIYQKATAGNLINRLISELGLLGIGIIVFFFASLAWTILTLKGTYQYLKLALLVGIVAFFVRNGAYASYGIAFYVVMWTRLAHYQRATRQEPGAQNVSGAAYLQEKPA